ncbi:MAG: BON domain-containing protein [Pseudomonadota bacterium]
MPHIKSLAENKPAAVGAEPGFSARTRGLNPVSHDVVLQIRILERLQGDPRVDASLVNVVVRNRSATLFGSAVTEAQRTLMHTLTTQVSGIIEVTNRLKVAPLAQ